MMSGLPPNIPFWIVRIMDPASRRAVSSFNDTRISASLRMFRIISTPTPRTRIAKISTITLVRRCRWNGWSGSILCPYGFTGCQTMT
jgi:hypothetical protein